MWKMLQVMRRRLRTLRRQRTCEVVSLVLLHPLSHRQISFSAALRGRWAQRRLLSSPQQASSQTPAPLSTQRWPLADGSSSRQATGGVLLPLLLLLFDAPSEAAYPLRPAQSASRPLVSPLQLLVQAVPLRSTCAPRRTASAVSSWALG